MPRCHLNCLGHAVAFQHVEAGNLLLRLRERAIGQQPLARPDPYCHRLAGWAQPRAVELDAGAFRLVDPGPKLELVRIGGVRLDGEVDLALVVVMDHQIPHQTPILSVALSASHSRSFSWSMPWSAAGRRTAVRVRRRSVLATAAARRPACSSAKRVCA